MSTIKVNNIDPPNVGEGVSIDGLQMPTAGALSNRRININGEMSVTQRGNVNVTAGGGVTSTAADRFGLLNYWGSGQVNTSVDTQAPDGFDTSLKLEVNTAAAMSGSTGYSCNLASEISTDEY